MSFSVRKGEAKDAKAIYDLIVELAVFEKEPNAVEITVEDILQDGFSENPKFLTFVAEENNIIIGMPHHTTYAFYRLKPPLSQRTAVVP